MKLSEMYEQLLEELKEQKRQEGLEQGREQGEKRERRAMVESILQVRFGEVDAELAKIVDKVVNISREEFTPLLLQLSREELLARFRN